MRPVPVVEAQVRLQVLLELRDAPIVGPAKGHAPQLGEDRPLQGFDGRINPGSSFGQAVGVVPGPPGVSTRALHLLGVRERVWPYGPWNADPMGKSSLHPILSLSCGV
jgi:hypothetical protein